MSLTETRFSSVRARFPLRSGREPCEYIYSHAASNRAVHVFTHVASSCISLCFFPSFRRSSFFFSSHPLSARRRAWMQKGWRKGRKVERVGGESFETSSHDFVPSRKRAFHPLFFRDWHALNAG